MLAVEPLIEEDHQKQRGQYEIKTVGIERQMRADQPAQVQPATRARTGVVALQRAEQRLRALQRRNPENEEELASSAHSVGALRYDKYSGAIYHGDAVLELTPRELALLQALMVKPGHAVSKEHLFGLVFPGEKDVQYEAIEVVVYRLRKKLAGTGTTLMTLRGLGYLLKSDT